MLVLIAIFLLLFVPLIMLVIRIIRPAFSYYWLIAALGALLAWMLVVVSGLRLPQTVSLIAWEPQSLFSVSPSLLIDQISWSYATALVSLALAVILTVVARMQAPDWRAWAGSLGLCALGLVAVLAGNPLTLMLAWASLDLAELLVLLIQIQASSLRERVVLAFAARAAGILLLLAAGLSAQSSGGGFSFANIPPSASIFLLLAAGLRLGVLPIHLPISQEPPLRRGLGTSLRLVPVGASLVLLARTASIQTPAPLSLYLIILTGLAAVFGAGAWALASDELSGRPFWILGMAALSVAAALNARPAASLAWGVACLLEGGLVFLLNVRGRRTQVIIWLGLFCLSSVPFSPTWMGLGIYQPSNSMGMLLLMGLFVLAQVLILIGYARHSLGPRSSLEGAERWVWVIYPAGLALLPLMNILISLRVLTDWKTLPIAYWLGGLFAPGIAIVLWLLRKRMPDQTISMPRIGEEILSFNWLYRLFWRVYRTTSWFIGWITTILEGDAAILWALVLLALLLSLISQARAGG